MSRTPCRAPDTVRRRLHRSAGIALSVKRRGRPDGEDWWRARRNARSRENRELGVGSTSSNRTRWIRKIARPHQRGRVQLAADQPARSAPGRTLLCETLAAEVLRVRGVQRAQGLLGADVQPGRIGHGLTQDAVVGSGAADVGPRQAECCCSAGERDSRASSPRRSPAHRVHVRSVGLPARSAS